jgi:hypothetical protein
VAPGLLGLLARALGLLPDHVDPVPDPIYLLADVLSGRQLPQRTSVLIPTGVLALAALLSCCLCHFTLPTWLLRCNRIRLPCAQPRVHVNPLIMKYVVLQTN